MSIDLMLAGLLQGLILAIIAYAIMIPFRFLDFSDLTVEGAYPLGGAICAVCLGNGIHPMPAIFMSMMCAGIMGIGTAMIYLELKVNSMLSGIILSTMVYSINLRIMGKPNVALFNCANLFGSNIGYNIMILVIILTLILLLMALFLRTDFGLRFRIVGLNPGFAAKQKISIKKCTMGGLFLAGSLSGLAGSLMVQIQNYMDISIGMGMLIHGLASLMIGEAIIGNYTINRQLLAPILGALVYQQIQGLVLSLGLSASDLKLFTGGTVLLVIALQKWKR